MTKIAVFVHSYCLNGEDGPEKGKYLTHMSREAIRTGAIVAVSDNAVGLIVGAAYDTGRYESTLYKRDALKFGVATEKIHFLFDIKNTYDEAERAVAKALELEAERLVVVAEKWHASRSEKAFRQVCPPGLEIEMRKFRTPRFEKTLEPSALKSWRAKHAWSWILWTKALELVPSTVSKKISKWIDK